MSDALEYLNQDAERRARMRVDRIAETPGRATVDDVMFLIGRIKMLQTRLDFINNELPRLKMKAGSRGGRV